MPQIDTPARLSRGRCAGRLGVDLELLSYDHSLRTAAAGLTITEVPSYEHPRIHGESNLSTFRDGRRVLHTILTEWHNR